MKFTLTIDCDNDAFHHQPSDYEPAQLSTETLDQWATRQEVSRLLQVAAVKCGRHDETSGQLVDLQGVVVGAYQFVEA